jgi:threonine dehydratase
MKPSYCERILNARVYDVAIESPLMEAPGLSKRLANRVLLKREDLQPVFSFKLRGAYNKIYHLNEEERARGVIAASAGNHAQGVALAGSRLGVKATIVMPRTTPGIKVQAVRELGGRAILHGDTYDEAYGHALELAAEKGMTFVHPYDDPDVIAGQGTIGMELLRQHPDEIEAVFVPVGGGGLIAGIAVFLKQLRPAIRIIGVEPEDAPCLHQALAKGRRVILKEVGLFADGVAVAQVGRETFRVVKNLVDEVVTVTTDEICAAIKDIYDETRSVAEPAGALGVAGMKKYVADKEISGRNLIAINSGANMNFDRLRHVSERAEIGEHREALFVATIPEKPGSFLRFCKAIGKRGITEFNYRYADVQDAQIFVGIKLEEGLPDRETIFDDLKAKGYPLVDFTDNEVAKIHLRYMVGGHAGNIPNERLYRFQFPERPGALLQFLSKIGRRWNISLFHYRNHGADYGRVLVGMQVPKEDNAKFRDFLEDLGYPYWDESDNPIYRLFLD